jgi:hypothetical protein
MCYRHNLDRPESGPWSKMGLKNSYNGLADPMQVFWAQMSVYLDRYVCLNSLDRDS